LYRPFARHAWNVLNERCSDVLQPVEIPDDLSFNDAISAPGTETRISVKAFTAQPNHPISPIRYARYALMETVASESSGPIQTSGIQIFNMLIFPLASTNLPVWGADFVSLPGNKHLVLLDAQPMDDVEQPSCWKDWYNKHAIDALPWGGDLSEEVKPFVSEHALWTRLNDKDGTGSDPIELIQGPIMDAFREHLDIYLDLILWPESNTSKQNRQTEYLQYRLQHDPARPMLKKLYGEEWTERLLQNIMFPPIEQFQTKQ
jgi:phycoerythrobilin:ferredoxin oxidoreductase